MVADKTLSIAVQALNGFPLFELMLRIKEPSRLPGTWGSRAPANWLTQTAGIYFETVTTGHSQQAILRLRVSGWLAWPGQLS